MKYQISYLYKTIPNLFSYVLLVACVILDSILRFLFIYLFIYVLLKVFSRLVTFVLDAELIKH